MLHFLQDVDLKKNLIIRTWNDRGGSHLQNMRNYAEFRCNRSLPRNRTAPGKTEFQGSNSSKCDLLFPCSSARGTKATFFPSCWSKEPSWWATFNRGLNLQGPMTLDWRTSRTKNQNESLYFVSTYVKYIVTAVESLCRQALNNSLGQSVEIPQPTAGSRMHRNICLGFSLWKKNSSCTAKLKVSFHFLHMLGFLW